jgi:metal-responsive CopG/Arc/MetJ family transcriptional regulator
MSRIESRLQSASDKDTQCGGPFPADDAERLNNAWRPAGYRSRGDFIHDAVMDAVEVIEQAKGGREGLAKLEMARAAAAEAEKKAEETEKRAEPKGKASAQGARA